MELKDTISLMTSSDYKERFIAEYWQLKIRYEKLKHFNNLIEAAYRTNGEITAVVIEPEHDCPYGVLREQQRIMGEYLHLLEIRALVEDIKLEEAK